MGPFNGPEFWNPKVRCLLSFSPPAVLSVLPPTYKWTEMILAGRSKAQTIDALRAAYAKKEQPALDPEAMFYMMSKQAYFADGGPTDGGVHNMAHLIFSAPLVDGALWRANLPNSPVILNPQLNGAPELIDLFMVSREPGRLERWPRFRRS